MLLHNLALTYSLFQTRIASLFSLDEFVFMGYNYSRTRGDIISLELALGLTVSRPTYFLCTIPDLHQ